MALALGASALSCGGVVDPGTDEPADTADQGPTAEGGTGGSLYAVPDGWVPGGGRPPAPEATGGAYGAPDGSGGLDLDPPPYGGGGAYGTPDGWGGGGADPCTPGAGGGGAEPGCGGAGGDD